MIRFPRLCKIGVFFEETSFSLLIDIRRILSLCVYYDTVWYILFWKLLNIIICVPYKFFFVVCPDVDLLRVCTEFDCIFIYMLILPHNYVVRGFLFFFVSVFFLLADLSSLGEGASKFDFNILTNTTILLTTLIFPQTIINSLYRWC